MQRTNNKAGFIKVQGAYSMNVNKQKKDNSNILQWIIPTLLLLFFLVITLLNYYSSMAEEARTKVFSRLSSQASSLCEYYDDSISSLTKIAELTAAHCAEAKDIFSKDNVVLLSNLIENTNIKNAYIMKMDGMVIDRNGNISKGLDDIPADYTALLDGNTQVTPFMEDKNGDQVLLIAAPIKTSAKMLGIEFLVYQPNMLDKIIDTPDNLSSNVYVLVSDEGRVLECAGAEESSFEVGDDLFDQLERAAFLEGSLPILRQNIRNQKDGIFEIERKGEKTKVFICEPIGDYHASVVMLTNHTQVERNISDANKSTRSLVYKITISIAIFALIIVTINIISRTKFIKENKELQSKAETDLLTDLLNKIATEKKIKDYLQNEGKEKKSIMFVLDVDNFKKINDTMGHAFGDEVLSTLGKQLRAEFRVNDIIGRTGGDEFTIFLKDLKDDATMKREAERVAMFFRNFKVGEYTKYFATASIGAAVYPSDATDFETLYKSADQALYKAKKRGKNQLAFYREEDSEQETNQEIIDPAKFAETEDKKS